MQLHFQIPYAVDFGSIKKTGPFTCMFPMSSPRCIRKICKRFCLSVIPDLHIEPLSCPKLGIQVRGKIYGTEKNNRDYLVGYIFIRNWFKTILKKIVSIKMNSHIQFSNFTAFSI